MHYRPDDTAVVAIDPQNDVLSPAGVAARVRVVRRLGGFGALRVIRRDRS